MADDKAVLLPKNATAWERCNSRISTRMLSVPVALILKERDPMRCDAAFVAPLAWERSVHYWNPGDDAGNRARIASSLADHKGYGAPAALEAEIALDTGYVIAIREFWELPGLVWPDFVVDVVYSAGAAWPALAGVYASALRRKPPRDVLDRVRVFAETPPAPIVVGAACFASFNGTVFPVDGAPLPPSFAVGAATRIVCVFTVSPFVR